MTRILFASYSGLLGGAERVLLDCATALDGDHILACPAGGLADRARAAGLTVLILPERSLRLRGSAAHRFSGPIALAAHARELHGLARDLDPELVVAWGMRSALAALALGPGRPFAFDHHDFLPGPLIGAAVRCAARRAVRVTVPSRAVARELDTRGSLAGRIRVVAPGVDPACFAVSPDGLGTARVLVIGALAGWKRPELALEIAACARRRRPELTVRLLGATPTGDGALPAALAERAAAADLAGAVALAGASSDVKAELGAAGCLLHCADREPFGIAVLEAMAAGLPVVVPDSGGPREIVTDGCGVRYRPGDATAGAQALEWVLADPDAARAMGAAGRDRARARFTRERAQAGFRAALDAPLTGRPRAVRAPRDGAGIDVVTVTHNSAGELPSLAASLARHLPGARLIVVDSGSVDGSVAAARDAGAEVIALEDNVGFGRACNRGLQAVTAPVTALLNPDVELIDGSLGWLAAEAGRGDRPERILAPLLLGADGRRQDSAHPHPAGAAELVRTALPPALAPGPWLAPWRARRPRAVGWAIGAALVARSDTLRRLGPFDGSIFMFGEDMELGLRAGRAGVRTWFWPAARVLHRGAHSTAPAFGGEPFERLASARRYAVTRSLGSRAARRDSALQRATFASRIAVKRALGGSAERERRQLAAARTAQAAADPLSPSG